MNSDTKKILILCNDFPPINSIGAERPYSWYRYFKEFGLDPVVITKNWTTNGNNPFNQVGKNRLVEKTNEGVIIRAKSHLTPSHYFFRLFGKRLSFFRKGLTFIEKILAFQFSFLDQHISIYNEARRYIKANKIDLIITTGEPFLLFKYGYLLKKEFNIKWIADYRDGWSLNHVRSVKKDILNSFIWRNELKFEKKYTKTADLITTVDPDLARKIGHLTNKKVEVVYNGFWEYYDNKIDSVNKAKLVFNHTGTLTIGQRLEFLLDAIIELKNEKQITEKDFRLNLIGLEYFPDQMLRLQPYMKSIGEFIHTTPRLPKNEAVAMNLEADYLVNFTDENYSAIYAKTYDYIACQKPILVIPGDGNLLDEMITTKKLGYILNSKEELINFIKQPDTTTDVFSKDDFFKRKTQTGIFSKVIHELI
jgi:glycosyltransferase involved in cell wall biosynthesis